MDAIQAIVLAGGKGTRLAPLTDTRPKALVPLCGKPIVQWVLEHLREAGIKNVALSVAHMHDQIEAYFGDGSSLGISLSYLREPSPMGTGAWSRLVDWNRLADPFLVVNGDNVFWVDVKKLLAVHDQSSGATIASTRIESASVSGAELILPDASGRRMMAYVDRSESAPLLAARPSVLINSGWYVFSPSVREHIPDVLPCSNEAHIWPALVSRLERVGLYDADEPWFDSGTPERLARIESFIHQHHLHVPAQQQLA